jgi:hypothetical protein
VKHEAAMMADDPLGPIPYEHGKDRDVLLRLLSVTSSLAGLCIAALGFMEYGTPEAAFRTYADEVIAFDALLFVCCVYLILWALRTSSRALARKLSRLVDIVFLISSRSRRCSSRRAISFTGCSRMRHPPTLALPD